MYPIIVPFFGLCVGKYYAGFEWKHRYFLCFVVAVLGLLFLAQPGAIFGYSSNINLGNQLIACVTSLIAGIFAAIYLVSNTIIRTLTDSYTKHVLIGIESNASAEKAESIIEDYLDFEISSQRTVNETSCGASDAPIATEETPLMSLDDNNSDVAVPLDQIDALSNEFIICNEWALVTVTIEYASLITMITTLICTIFSVGSGSWFWDEFVMGYYDATTTGIVSTWAAGVVWIFDYYFYTLGVFKLRDATLTGLLDTTDVFFSFILSYYLLGETANEYDIIGSVLIVVTVVLAVYPWQRYEKIPKWW